MKMDWKAGLGLSFLLATTAALRLPGLGRSLWYDECVYSTSWKMTSFYDLAKYAMVKPEWPFYRVFMFFWIRIFGEQEVILRMPSFICGMLVVILTYLIAKKWHGEIRVAFTGAMLLSISPVHIWYSREAVPYSLLLLFFLLSVYSHLWLLERGLDRRWFTIYWASACLAAFTHPYSAAFLPMSAAFTFFRNRKLGKWMVLGNGLILVLMTSYLGVRYFFGRIARGHPFLGSFSLLEWWNVFFNWFATGNCIRNSTFFPFLSSDAISFTSQVFFFALLVLGIGANLPGGRNQFRLEKCGYLLLLPLFFFTIAQLGFHHFYTQRYLLLILPFFLIFLSMGTTALKWKKVNFILTLVLFGISIVAVTEFYRKADQSTVYKPNPDWREAAQFLRDRERDAEGTFLLFSETPSDELEYYLNRNGSKAKVITEIGTIAHLQEKFPSNGVGTVFLIRNLFWPTRMDLLPKEARELLRLRFQKTWSFRGIEIHEFTLLSIVH